MTQYRLAHYLALCGVASRRGSARLIEANRVTINNTIARHTDCVDESKLPSICVDGKPIKLMEPKQYWLFNKPVGVDCRLLPNDPSSLIHFLPETPRLFPAGRLDKDSRGLLLLTNDGELTQKLMHPDYEHVKTYHVTVDKPFNANFICKMAAGVSYQEAGTTVNTLPSKVKAITTVQFEIELTQGLNRQIRKMCRVLGFRVVDLQRVAIGQLHLGSMSEKQRRALTPAEVSLLLKAN